MYVPAHFEETRTDELHRLIREYPLGILVTGHGGLLDANHLPSNWNSPPSGRCCAPTSPATTPCGRNPTVRKCW